MGKRILIALTVLSVLGILGGVLALWGYEVVRDEIETTTDVAVPRMVEAQNLAREVTRFLNVTDAITRARSSDEVQRLHAMSREIEHGIHSRLDHMDSTGGGAARLRNEVEALPLQATRAREAVDELLRLDSELEARTEQSRRVVDEVGVTLAALLVEAEAADDRTVASRERVERIERLRRSFAEGESIINRVSDCDTEEQVRSLANEFQGELDRLARSLLGVRPAARRSRLAQRAQQMIEFVSGSDGLLNCKSAALRESARLEEVRSEDLVRNARIQGLVSGLNDRSAAFVRSSSESTKRMVERTRLGIIGTLVLFVLGSFVLTELYVRRRLVARLDALHGRMRALIAGDLDTPVDRSGDDEIAELGAAVEEFRDNAVELRRVSERLEVRNRELDRFTHVASHDLKSPMRAIANLANWVVEDTEGMLPAESAEHLRKIQDRTQRAERLLEDLLRYARLGFEETAKEDIDLHETVTGLVELLDVPERFQIEIDEALPTVRTARPPLELVIRNLVANAITHHDRPDGRVCITAAGSSSGVVITISDDGPGTQECIASALEDRGGPGRRGSGLVFVTRAIDVVGGRLEVAPNSPRGLRFDVHWPRSA